VKLEDEEVVVEDESIRSDKDKGEEEKRYEYINIKKEKDK
jgi:hypothetical protein